MTSQRKILLVDDSATTLVWEKLILTSGGYEVVTANNGTEALQRVSAENPDLVFLDIVMPEPDGLEVCRRLRASAATRSLPIIMVSDASDENMVKEAYGSGCTDFIGKPVNADEMLEKVRRYLGN
jgi:CheY-like chemotaxis protein